MSNTVGAGAVAESQTTRTVPLQAVPARPKLVFFYSPTSGRSRRCEGFLSQVLQRNHNHETFDIVRVDADKQVDLVERLRVTTVPELLVVEGKKVRARVRKPRGVTDLTDALAPWLRR